MLALNVFLVANEDTFDDRGRLSEMVSIVGVSSTEKNIVTDVNSVLVKPWSVDSLLMMLGDRWHYWWIKKRIQRTWNEIEAAVLRLRGGQTCSSWTNHRRRRVITLQLE